MLHTIELQGTDKDGRRNKTDLRLRVARILSRYYPFLENIDAEGFFGTTKKRKGLISFTHKALNRIDGFSL